MRESKASRRGDHEDPEVKEVLEAGANTDSAAWVTEELAGVNLGDDRLNRRLVTTAVHLALHPTAPINNACPDWATTKATYRLFGNKKVEEAEILEPHVRATARRMLGFDEPLLVVQDTVFISYKTHKKTKDLGQIGTDKSDRGLIMHNALVFTSSGGVPLGLLSQKIWARKEMPNETTAKKIARVRNMRIEEKESYKWIECLRDTVDRAPPECQVITMGDREVDFFEFFASAEEFGAYYLIRAKTDRQLDFDESESDLDFDSITEALEASPVLGTMAIFIPGNGDRKARTAEVGVKAVQVTLRVPQRYGRGKESAPTEPVTLRVLGVTEIDPPEGVKDTISWVLLTNLWVPSFASAAEKVRWYAKRFGIETWHKVLKSGCTVEDCRLRRGKRLIRYLALSSIIGVRLMYVAYLARAQPHVPATTVLSAIELEALHLQLHGELPSPEDKSPTLQEAVRMLGRLGGYLGRKCDKEPGVTVVWRGWPRLYDTVRALAALYKGGQLRIPSRAKPAAE
jgi:hypothetical protein